jgi:YesN/AraC family two-component response regulator
MEGVKRLKIRNMASHRCVSLVEMELNQLHIEYRSVELGEVELKGEISDNQQCLLELALQKSGLELMNSSNARVVRQIKKLIHEWMYLSENIPEESYSDFLKREMNLDYAYLSHLFSNEMGTTIERYIIAQKIERVKELIVYDNLSISDITYKMRYSSVAHLSNQFKKYTGITPVQFRQSARKFNRQAKKSELIKFKG